MLEFISQPWAWYVAGPIIALTMFLLLYFGKNFGVSANLRTMCSIGGAGKVNNFFNFDWKSQSWNLVFVVGSVLGGFIASQYLTNDVPMKLAEGVVEDMKSFGIENPGSTLIPEEVFSFDALFTLRGAIMLILGGFLVGFGARYAGGCTSGHAISGLSDLQLPSLIAVIGFFIGGLIMTFLLLPMIMNL